MKFNFVLLLICTALFLSCSTTKLPEDVTVYLTTNNRSSDFAKKSTILSHKPHQSPDVINLDPSVRYQTMDGFGAAITGSTSYNLLKMKPDDRTAFLKETFSHEEGMGQSYIRISIGGSDFSLSEYTCCDTKGIENFALQSEELDYVIPVLKEIIAINPDIKIMGSPWTCPRWMKVNNLKDLQEFNSWTSGQLNPLYYQDYAGYFVKWIQAMKAEGINIYAVTPQNEPLNRGNSVSLYMTWREQRDFIKNALGPGMSEAKLSTKIYVFDHNYDYDQNKSENADQGKYPLMIFEDQEADKYITGAAYHNYGGNKNELNTVHNARPDKELIFTETSIGTWNDGQNLAVRLMNDMEEVALGTINRWCKGVIVWNLMLDSEKGPNRDGGCQTCYGAVDINSADYKTITRNSHYYVIGHLSSVVKPGAVRIGSSCTDTGMIQSAFENTDGTYALVLMNSMHETKEIAVSDGRQYFSYEVPGKSVVSFRWKK